MQFGQTLPYVLPSQVYSAGNRTVQTLRDLPKQMFGRLCHLSKVVYSVSFTPTFSVAPTTVGHNNFFTACDFWDGSIMRFQGGLNHIRAKERLQAGRNRLADASTATASTTARYFKRVLHVGPPQFIGAPSDFMIPTGYLENGELRFAFGQLSDFKGTVTVVTGTARVVAWLILADELRIPPAYQFQNQSTTASDLNLAGRALYESIALLNSSNFDAFTSGGIGNVRLDFGQGDMLNNCSSRDLTAGFLDDFASGDIGAPQGDLEATSDANNVQVDRSTPTALTTPSNDLQPVLWSPPDSRISKLMSAESVCRLRWDGTSTTAVIVFGRILSQPGTVVATVAAKALGRLGLQQKSLKIKTISKVKYDGPYGEYLPWKVEV